LPHVEVVKMKAIRGHSRVKIMPYRQVRAADLKTRGGESKQFIMCERRFEFDQNFLYGGECLCRKRRRPGLRGRRRKIRSKPFGGGGVTRASRRKHGKRKRIHKGKGLHDFKKREETEISGRGKGGSRLQFLPGGTQIILKKK